MSVAIDATLLQLYAGGIFNEKDCYKTLNHGVLVVGYTDYVHESSLASFWKVKNSWGADWGENGFFNMALKGVESESGMCGIMMAPSYPTA